MVARQWLLRNGYPDVVDLINDVLRRIKEKGVHTRRNWWETLAGDRNGRPRTIYGITFPVLVAAQIQQGVAVTDNATQRSPDEVPPCKAYHGRSLVLARQRAVADSTAAGCKPGEAKYKQD